MQIPVPAMAKTAGAICKNADMVPRPAAPSADDLLVLLAVGRSGRYDTAAEELGLNHTTISRRIAALEQSIGGRVLARVGGGWELTDLGREALSAAEAVESAMRSLTVDHGGVRTLEGVVRISATDGFSAYIAAPAAADGAAAAPQGGRRDRRRHPAGHPAAVRPRHRGGGRRTPGAPRQGHPARRLPPGPVRLRATTSPNTAPRRASPTSPAIRWSTSSTRCCRSTTSTWPELRTRRCANQSRPPTSSCMSRRPGRPQAWACCRASWPTGTTT